MVTMNQINERARRPVLYALVAVLFALCATVDAHQVTSLFDRIDHKHGDKDALLTLDEIEAWHAHPHTKNNMGPMDTWRVTFKMMDTDGDGKLTRDEFGYTDTQVRHNDEGVEIVDPHGDDL